MNEEIITPVKEDIEVGLSTYPLDIKLKLTMQKEAPDASFDYIVSIDEQGYIVFVPKDTTCSFTEVSGTSVDIEEIINDNEKTFSVDLTTEMMFEDDNQEDPSWEAQIDEVGQAVIYPVADRTSFLTASVKESLNLITEEQEKDDENPKEEEIEDSESKSEEEKEDKIQDTIDGVKAQVKESLDEPHKFDTIASSIRSFTEDFHKESGIIKTGYTTEAIYAKKILEKYYSEVTSSTNENWIQLNYSNRVNKTLTENIDPFSSEFITKKEAAEKIIDDIEESLTNVIEQLDALERLFREIGIHNADIEGYFTNYIRNFIESDREISCYDFRQRLEDYAEGESEE